MPERYAAIAEALIARGYQIVMTGAPTVVFTVVLTAGLLVTTEAMVAEKPEKKAPMGMPPGGGGMGGDMDF